MTSKDILFLLPYKEPFLFVDDLTQLSEEGVTGHYTFKDTEYFYEGHFKENPITPGVILTESMAQIGVVCLGIYLLRNEISQSFKPQMTLTSSQMDFFIPIFPGEKITVISEKVVFRFNKLTCKVKLYNQKQELACRGLISGMFQKPTSILWPNTKKESF